MSDADYPFAISVNPSDGTFRVALGQNTFSTTAFNIGVKNVSGTNTDEEFVSGVLFGDLA
jgi:hypothetical protein